MTDKLFLVAFVVLLGFGLYRFGAYHATSDIRSQSKAIDNVLRSEKPAIDKADSEAIENAKLAEIEKRAAEAALKNVKAVNACQPVPVECLAGLRTDRREAGSNQAGAKVSVKPSQKP